MNPLLQLPVAREPGRAAGVGGGFLGGNWSITPHRDQGLRIPGNIPGCSSGRPRRASPAARPCSSQKSSLPLSRLPASLPGEILTHRDNLCPEKSFERSCLQYLFTNELHRYYCFQWRLNPQAIIELVYWRDCQVQWRGISRAFPRVYRLWGPGMYSLTLQLIIIMLHL